MKTIFAIFLASMPFLAFLSSYDDSSAQNLTSDTVRDKSITDSLQREIDKTFDRIDEKAGVLLEKAARNQKIAESKKPKTKIKKVYVEKKVPVPVIVNRPSSPVTIKPSTSLTKNDDTIIYVECTKEECEQILKPKKKKNIFNKIKNIFK